MSTNLTRPYLVIPKLIEQPTWGGEYIARAKQWQNGEALAGRKIGQSYELFSGSNLSLLNSSDDPDFAGELTDRDAVQAQTTVANSLSLASLIADSPEAVLGKNRIAEKGAKLNLLLKFTQALGNSFQLHIKAGTTHPVWKPKPESWYYFEPGLITLGVRPDVDWQAYEAAVTTLQEHIAKIGSRVGSKAISFELAESEIKKLIEQYDPWAFVNLVKVQKGQVIDLSAGGLHHSWEEDAAQAPLGNVLYELQTEALDYNSTLRNFDKGKMMPDGSTRELHIPDYFALIDRTAEANDPAQHTRTAELITRTSSYTLERLLHTKYYSLDKLSLAAGASYTETITQFKHLFVQTGSVEISTASGSVTLTAGHSCFIPAGAQEFSVKSTAGTSEGLISY